jgi:hypothetical protein
MRTFDNQKEMKVKLLPHHTLTKSKVGHSKTMKLQFGTPVARVLVFFIVSIASALAHAQSPTIDSITGYSDSVGVKDGRWTGQPSTAPGSASNQYKNLLASDSYNYGNDSANPYYWDIKGRNFGVTKGTVSIGPNPSPFTSITIVSWTANTVRIKAVATRSYLKSGIKVKVKTSTGVSSAEFNDASVGIIKSRGCGQCTWFVAKTRLDNSLSIPSSAYSTTAAIPAVGASASDYRPAKWDCLNYSGRHVAIITSAPTQTNNTDGSITFTFTVSEYNATWNEALSTSTRTYKVSKLTGGTRKILTGIGTNANSTWVASGYYR